MDFVSNTPGGYNQRAYISFIYLFLVEFDYFNLCWIGLVLDIDFTTFATFGVTLEFILEWTTSLDSSSGTLICPSLCPRHVGRNNYVPLFGVDHRSI